MKTCSWFILWILFATLLSQLTFAQTIEDVFGNNKLPVTYIGIDFSKVHYYGDTGKVSTAEMKDFFNSINGLTLTEVNKYDVKKAFRKEIMIIDTTLTSQINMAIDREKIISTDDNSYKTFSSDTIQKLVSTYQFEPADSGVALVIVMEGMSKEKKEACMWFAFLKKENNELIFTKRVTGKASGLGFRNYWAGAVAHAIEKVYSEKFMVWKNLSVSDRFQAIQDSVKEVELSKYKIGLVVGFEFNACGGNNTHTRSFAYTGPLISQGVMLHNLVYIGCSFGIQSMQVDNSYGPEYSNVFNENLHQYFLGQLFIEMRVYPLKGKLTPVLSGGYGKGMGLFSVSLADGVMFNAGAGLEYKFSQNARLDLSYTYQYQELAFDSYGNDHSSIKKDRGTLYMSYAGVNIGFLICFGIK